MFASLHSCGHCANRVIADFRCLCDNPPRCKPFGELMRFGHVLSPGAVPEFTGTVEMPTQKLVVMKKLNHATTAAHGYPFSDIFKGHTIEMSTIANVIVLPYQDIKLYIGYAEGL